MTPERFRQLGEGAFGKRWKAPLSRELRCDVATVWRYATGKSPIPFLVERRMEEFIPRKKPTTA